MKESEQIKTYITCLKRDTHIIEYNYLRKRTELEKAITILEEKLKYVLINEMMREIL